MKNLLIVLLGLQLFSCEKNTNTKQHAKEFFKENTPILQSNAFRCEKDSPSFVIFDETEETLKYCSNGSWKNVPEKMQAEDDSFKNPIAVDVSHKLPNAHEGLLKPKKKKKVKKETTQNEAFYCRGNEEKDAFRCSKNLAH